jgi:hypothetical protein
MGSEACSILLPMVLYLVINRHHERIPLANSNADNSHNCQPTEQPIVIRYGETAIFYPVLIKENNYRKLCNKLIQLNKKYASSEVN